MKTHILTDNSVLLRWVFFISFSDFVFYHCQHLSWPCLTVTVKLDSKSVFFFSIWYPASSVYEMIRLYRGNQQSPGGVCPEHRNNLSGEVWRRRRPGRDVQTDTVCTGQIRSVTKSVSGEEVEPRGWKMQWGFSEIKVWIIKKWTQGQTLFTEYTSQAMDRGQEEVRSKARRYREKG